MPMRCRAPLRYLLPGCLAALSFAPAATAVASSAPRWSLEARLGNAWSAPLPLTIRQPGAPTLGIDPCWSTRGFEFPLYYGVRAARGGAGAAWALDLVHHKVYLQDPPPEVGTFSISHGYNLLTVQRLRTRGPWFSGAGAGIVVAHPESEVRGRRLDESRGLFRDGYYLAGPTLAVLAGRSLDVGGGARAGFEARVTCSYAEVPVADGYARVPNLALHAALALGWRQR